MTPTTDEIEHEPYRDLIIKWRDIAAGTEGFASDDYAKALRRCANELEEVREDEDTPD